MLILDGREVARAREKAVSSKVEEFKKLYKKPPFLTVIMVGDNPSSKVYVKNKELACKRVGIEFDHLALSKDIKAEELDETIAVLNADPDVHGILVQMPLPYHLRADNFLNQLNPFKDVDGLNPENLGLLVSGKPRVIPCTPKGIMTMLHHYNLSVEGKRAVVVGRSSIVGRPMAMALTNANATVTLCHSKTPDIRKYTREADIVVVAVGQPGLFGKDDFSSHSIIFDVGINRMPDGKLSGDVRFDEVKDHVKAITPVPGGVGPMTVLSLLENTLHLAEAWESFGR